MKFEVGGGGMLHNYKGWNCYVGKSFELNLPSPVYRFTEYSPRNPEKKFQILVPFLFQTYQFN